jgi:Ca2+-binding RTX toxin-like protein
VTVDPTADTTVESDETVILTLATGTGYTVGTTTAVTGTITNDDVTLPSITLAVSPSSVTEDGTTNLVYTFTRTGVTTNALTVNYTLGGTATLNTDYTRTGTTNTVTFAANSSTATVTVDPTADTTVESNETVILTLAAGTGYAVGTPNAATGTITNDDVTLPSITLAVSPSSVTEDGTTNLVYTFTRSGVTTNPLTVNYTLGGTATLNTDYTRTGTTNTVTFAANSSTATVTVDPTADTTVENNETVALTLATGTGYTVGTPNAVTGTILNDDVTLPSITLSLNYSGISENSPSNFVYTFTRTGVTTNALTVNYNIAGTASANDYTGATPGNGKTITFNPGSTTTSITINPTADTVVEPNETISLQLAAGTGYSIGTTAAQIATIINDDGTRRHVGTNGKDVLLGTNANDYLIGGAGNDILTGGTGGDIFYFASSNLGNDAITDFTPGQDFIQVSGQGFGGGLMAGDTITQVQFLIGSSATNASQRFIYNSTSGALLFDVDGNGIQSAQQIATLNTGLALTYEDIFVS